MYTLAVANHKGGVGKTFTAVNLGYQLAQLGHRVLLVGADSQAHATYYLFKDHAFDRDLTDVLTAAIAGNRSPRLSEVVVAVPRIPNLHLVPSSLRVAELDLRLTTDFGQRHLRLSRALAEEGDTYDVALIDCPPALSLMVLNALAAADGILAPVAFTNFSLVGLNRFLTWVEHFRAEGVIHGDFLGVLPTFFDGRQRADRQGLILLHNSGHRIFDPVPRRTGSEALVAAQEFAGETPDSAAVADPYGKLAETVVEMTRHQVHVEARVG